MAVCLCIMIVYILGTPINVGYLVYFWDQVWDGCGLCLRALALRVIYPCDDGPMLYTFGIECVCLSGLEPLCDKQTAL